MNFVALTGRLVKDPELRYIPSGKAVCNFTLAVDKSLTRDKKEELQRQSKPTADFIRIVIWGKPAESAAKYLAKGRKIAIEGSIATSTYEDQNGQKRYSTDVFANHIEYLEKSANQAAPEHEHDDFMPASFGDEEVPF